MAYLAVQVSVFMAMALTIGAVAGWLVAKFIYHQDAAECQTELLGLRRNYDAAVMDNAQLRLRLRQQEEVLREVRIPPSEADYGQFLQLRKALEKTRRQYEGLLEQFHQQEQALTRLSGELQGSQQALVGLRAQLHREQAQPPLPANGFMPGSGKRDDLTRIQGINQRLAKQLEALGILTYRQVAEFTSDDLHHIQRIIGSEIQQPAEGWVLNARSLYQQQHQPLQA